MFLECVLITSTSQHKWCLAVLVIAAMFIILEVSHPVFLGIAIHSKDLSTTSNPQHIFRLLKKSYTERVGISPNGSPHVVNKTPSFTGHLPTACFCMFHCAS